MKEAAKQARIASQKRNAQPQRSVLQEEALAAIRTSNASRQRALGVSQPRRTLPKLKPSYVAPARRSFSSPLTPQNAPRSRGYSDEPQPIDDRRYPQQSSNDDGLVTGIALGMLAQSIMDTPTYVPPAITSGDGGDFGGGGASGSWDDSSSSSSSYDSSSSSSDYSSSDSSSFSSSD